MANEIDDLTEHYTRYRAVTLEHLERLSDAQLSWRPRPDAFTCAQQFMHIIETEEFYMPGLFHGDWQVERMRFPSVMPGKAELQRRFESVRERTLADFASLTAERLDAIVPPALGATIECSLRWWLWYVLEHEIHHKAQLGEYLRHLGIVPPFFAMVLPDNQRPDIKARADLGGV